MLEYLHLKNVGPSPELTMELGPRLNLITGDNGLGKSFLLDIAWWALTRKWPAEVNPSVASGLMARPARSGPHGEVSNWLTSEAFDLGSARSLEAETAIAEARTTCSRNPPAGTMSTNGATTASRARS